MDRDFTIRQVEDDGHTIADMNVDGMPSKSPSQFNPLYLTMKRHRRWRGETGEIDFNRPPVELTAKEVRVLQVNAVLGVLAICAVFLVVFLAFILFCLYVWFA